MGEHRVSMLSTSLRRYEDPARSSDPRIRDLVAALSTLEVAPPPRAHFRAELREQLVAVAPRLIAEGPAVELRPNATPGAQASLQTRVRAGRFRLGQLARPLVVVVGVFAVFAMLLGGAVFVSKKSLPGDALYALKRANENVQLSMTHGTERGKTYLSFASTRVDEVKALLSHASALAVGSGPTAAADVSPHTAKLVTSTLGSADGDLRNASQLLGAEAASRKSAAPLTVLTTWAPGQLGKLQTIAAGLPAGSLHDRVVSSATLVSQAVARANALRAVLGCGCLEDATTDQLGPVPCAVCPASSLPGVPVPGQTGATQRSTPAPQLTVPGGSGTASVPGSGSGTPGSVAPSAGSSGVLPSVSVPLPSLPLPSLPLPLPSSGPIVTDSCGVSASLGPIGVGVGSCGIRVHL